MIVPASMGAKFRPLYLKSSSRLSERWFRFLYMAPLALSARVEKILHDEKLKQVDLAKIAGVTKGLINQWINGPSKTMSYEPAKRLHDRYGYSIDWLMTGAGNEFGDAPAAGVVIDKPDEIELVRNYQAARDEEWKLTIRLFARLPSTGRARAARKINEFLVSQSDPASPAPPPLIDAQKRLPAHATGKKHRKDAGRKD